MHVILLLTPNLNISSVHSLERQYSLRLRFWDTRCILIEIINYKNPSAVYCIIDHLPLYSPPETKHSLCCIVHCFKSTVLATSFSRHGYSSDWTERVCRISCVLWRFFVCGCHCGSLFISFPFLESSMPTTSARSATSTAVKCPIIYVSELLIYWSLPLPCAFSLSRVLSLRGRDRHRTMGWKVAASGLLIFGPTGKYIFPWKLPWRSSILIVFEFVSLLVCLSSFHLFSVYNLGRMKGIIR